MNEIVTVKIPKEFTRLLDFDGNVNYKLDKGQSLWAYYSMITDEQIFNLIMHANRTATIYLPRKK